MKELLLIYLEFFKMGCVTFGGGYAMLPILRRNCVNSKKWVTEEEVIDFYSVSQALPGIIAINVSMFIGYKVKKLSGGIAAVLGAVSPCIIIITLIAMLLSNFQDNTYVHHAMAGVSVCVVALIFDAVSGLWKKGIKDKLGLVLCIAIFLSTTLTSISPIIVVVASALIGLIVRNAQEKARSSEGK